MIFVAALNLNPMMEPGAISSLKEFPETSQQNAPLSKFNRHSGNISANISTFQLNPDNSGAPLEVNPNSSMDEPLDASDSQGPGKMLSKWQLFKLNCQLIWVAMKNKEIHNTMLFFLVTGFINPIFEDAQYYFLLNECGFT
jgi:hypothetical protein